MWQSGQIECGMGISSDGSGGGSGGSSGGSSSDRVHTHSPPASHRTALDGWAASRQAGHSWAPGVQRWAQRCWLSLAAAAASGDVYMRLLILVRSDAHLGPGAGACSNQ